MRKRVLIITPTWHNRWRKYYKESFEQLGYSVKITSELSEFEKISHEYGVIIYMWANKLTRNCIDLYKGDAKQIVFCRRYEMFQDDIHKIDYSKVDHMIFCNDYFKAEFERWKYPVKTALIYNGMKLDDWTYKERDHGNKIALVGSIHNKKNIPLALYIMDKLPRDYELHIAGEVQDAALFLYIQKFTCDNKLNVTIHKHIESDKMDEWLDDKNYLLSTSISEGNPNCVLEAMAKGIKPIIHTWPGAEKQFGFIDTFRTIIAAVNRIMGNEVYYSSNYQEHIAQTFNFDKNFKQLLEVIDK